MNIRLHTILLLKLKKYILFPYLCGPGIFPAIPGFMQKSDLPEGSDNESVNPTNAINGCNNADDCKHFTPVAKAAVHPTHCTYNTINISFSLPVNAAPRSDLQTDPAGTSFLIKQGIKFPAMNDLKCFKVIAHDLEPIPLIFSQHKPTYLRIAA